MRAIILEQVDRLLAAQSGAPALRRLEAGEWPEELWEALEGLGLPLLLVPEELGGIGLDNPETILDLRTITETTGLFKLDRTLN